MFLRSIQRAAISNSRSPNPLLLNQCNYYASKAKTVNKKQESNKSKSKSKSSDSTAAAQSDSAAGDAADSAKARARRLADDDRDPSLDVGPNGRPLFTKTASLSSLTRKDACTYFKFR